MDKLQALYNLYLENGIITEKTSFDKFSLASDEVQSSLYNLGKEKGLFQTTELSTFKTAWSGGVKKKDDSEPVGDTEVITESITEQAPAEDGSSASQQIGPSEFDPSKFVAPEQALVQDAYLGDTRVKPNIEEPKTIGPSEFDPESFIAPEQPLIEDAYPGLFEAESDLIDRVGDKLARKYDRLGEDAEDFIPEIYADAFDEAREDKKFISSYDALPEELKSKIEPGLIRKNGKIVGLDQSLIPTESVKEIINQYDKEELEAPEGVIENLAGAIEGQRKEDLFVKLKKAGQLQEDILSNKAKIDKLREQGNNLLADQLSLPLNSTIEEYNNLVKETNKDSIVINSLDIISENKDMSSLGSIGTTALNEFIGYAESAPKYILGTLAHMAAKTGYSPGAPIPSATYEVISESYMQDALKIQDAARKTFGQDYRNKKSNFAGQTLGQIGFVVASSALGGAPAALSAGYTMSSGEMYREAKNSGLSHNDAMNLSVVYGAISAPLEMIPLKGAFAKIAQTNVRKEIIKQIIKQGGKNFTKEFAEQTVKLSLKPIIKETLKESAEEGFQEGAQYLLSKGLAETYNALKDEDKPEFLKANLMSSEFGSEFLENVLLGSVAGSIGSVTLNLAAGNVFVGSDYKAMENMFTDPNQMAKVNKQLDSYRKTGQIKTDEELQSAKEQVGIVSQSAAEVKNATKNSNLSVGLKKQLFKFTSERISLEKEIEGVKTASLVSDKKQTIQDLDQKISDIVSGNITEIDIIVEQKAAMAAKTEAEAIVAEDVELTEELRQEVKDIESFFADPGKKISDNLAVNKEEKIELSEGSKQITEFAQKASTAISSILPNTKIVLHNTTEEYTQFKSAEGASRGEYNPQTDTIHIDLSVADSKTVAHEVFHAVLLNKIKTEEQIQTTTKSMYDSVKQSLAAVPEISTRIENFSKMYEDNVQSEEALAELTGILASEYKQLNEPTKLRVKKWVNDIASVFGLDNVIKLTKDEEVIDLLNTLSKKVATGKQVTEKDIKSIKQKDERDQKIAEGNKLFNKKQLQDATKIANRISKRTGINYKNAERISKLDKERAKRISDSYEKAKSEPEKTEVKEAYYALIDETILQYEEILSDGYTVEVSNDEYSNSGEMIDDLIENKNMRIFSTESGFGAEGITDAARKSNPMLKKTKFKDKNGVPLLVNDVFRFVHDFFGHAKMGNGFGPLGEENAWNVHSRMYSPLARRAMTTETRGQNSWVNFSGINEKAFKIRDEARALRKKAQSSENKKDAIALLTEAERKINEVYDMMDFAEQKVALLPEEFTKTDDEISEETEQGTGGEIGTVKVPRQSKIKVVDAPNIENDNRPWVRDVLEMLDLNEIDGAKFITNMYDYTNAGATDLGNGFTIELLGGRNYVPLMMEKSGRKIGDVSNLAAFNNKKQAETFIRNSKEGKANLFAPHSGTLKESWQFQQHIFEQLVNLVIDKKILSNKKLIDVFNDGIKSKNGKDALAKFNVKNKSNLKSLNSFKSNPKELVRLLDIENNFSPDLRKILNTKIASDKTFQKAIGVNNLNEFYGRIADPLNIGISGGEIMTIVKFDPSTFEVAKTNPGDVDHHPSFGWTVKAKIENIYQPTKFFKSYDITEEYTKFNIDGTSVSRKAEVTEKEFIQKNVLSSAGAIPKVATVTTRQQRISDEDIESVIIEARNNNFTDEAIKYYLVNVKKQPAAKVNELLEVNVNLLDRMPKSFGNIEGGAAKGIKLFEKVQNYHTKLNKNNNKRKPANRLNEQQIVDEVIKFLEKQPEYKKEGSTKKKEISTQQAAMLSDIQKSVRMRPTAEMAEKIREARMVLAQRKKGIADIKKVQSAVRNFMRKALPKKLYTKSETLKLINKINDATVKNIDAVIAEVEKFVIEQNIKDLNARLSNLLDVSIYTKTQAGKKVAKKIDSETLERVKYINGNILSNKATAEEIDSKNSELNREFNEISAKTDLTVDDVQRMSDISIITGYNNSLQMDNQDSTKVTQLDSVIAQLEGVIEYGSSQLAERIAEQKKETDRIFEVGYKAVTGTDIDLSAENANEVLENKDFEFEYQKERKRLGSKLSRKLSEIGTSIKEGLFGTAEALDGLMDKINILPAELFGGDLQQEFTNKIDEATRTFKERRMMAETTIKDKLVEIYGKKWVNESRKNRNTINTGIYINEAAKKKDMPIMLSQNKMAYYYNQYKDPANRASFVNTFGVEADRVMEEMTNKLDPKVKQLADWQVDEFYPSLYKYYNDAYKKIYNADMPWNQFYAGILYRKGETIEPLDLLADKSIYNTAVGANSTKSRVQNNNKIEGMDMVDVMATYINQMEYFAAYSQPIREMNTFFKNKYIRNAIETIHNKQTMKFIDAMIEKIANKGGKQEFEDEFVNALNSAFVTSRIGLSPVVLIKQLLSIPTYANDIGIRNWTKYSAKNATQLAETWKEVRDNSVYMQDRKNDSILRTIETYKDSDMVDFVPSPTKKWLVDFLMYTTKFGDRTAIMLGGMPNYLYYKDQELKKGKTEKQAISIAIRKFERDTKRTQQSADLQDKDYFQTKGAIARALNMFLTTPKQYLRKEIQAVRNLGRMMSKSDKAAKGTAWQNLRTLAMYHVFLPTLFQYVALGLPGILREWREDEDGKDLWRAAILGNLNALFLYGEILAATGDLLTGKPWAGEQTRTVGLIQSSMNVIRKLKNAMAIKDEDKKEKAQKDAILELVNMTGAPASTIDKMVQNYKEIGTDEDLGKDIMRVLNYSKYQIEGSKKKKESFAKAPTTSMTDLKEYFPTLYDELKELDEELKVDID